MSTSRRLSQRGKVSKNSHTPGRTKGAGCVRPADHAIACKSNPYKGSGLKGERLARYERTWSYYRNANK